MYMTRSSNKNSYNRVFSMLKDHHKWFENSIPLIASENIPSPAVREAIVSDFGNRYAEGWPGERVYAGCVYIDKVEVECMSLAKKLFKAEFADFFKSYNMHINYDAAHVAGLIAGNQFQDPLREGADTMTMSTHKTLFGPQGGLVLGFEKYGDAIKKATFPGLTSSHHIHHMAAKAITFAEALEFGKDYAKQVIKNAKALAEALNEFGFKVLGEKRGYTKSHQIAVNVLDYSDGGKVEVDLEKANIIVNRQLIPGDIKAGRNYFHPGGIRLGVSEITRLGMKEFEMKEIASFIKKVIIDKKNPKKLASNVKSFRKNYQKVHYCFDNKLGAYEYIKLR